MDANRPLNPRQLKFVERYLATGNATQSYIDAGYKAKGHSAETSASELLRKPEVSAAVAEARRKANELHGITADWYAERVKLEAEREGDGSSHAARVSALKLAGDLLGVGEKVKHEHSGPDGNPIEHDHTGTYALVSLTPGDLAAVAGLLGHAAPGAGVRGDG